MSATSPGARTGSGDECQYDGIEDADVENVELREENECRELFGNSCIDGEKNVAPMPLLDAHVIDNIEGTTRKNYRCDACGRNFAKRFYFENHKRLHEGERQIFRCDLCAIGYKNFKTLKAHRRAKHARLSCATCSLHFADPKKLYEHFNDFHEDQLFKCAECSKAFLSIGSLTAHEKCHAPRRAALRTLPPRCDRCKKRHHASSACERETSCPTCGKTFKRASHLHDHMITHSGDAPFACDRCDSRFKMKRALNTHLIAVHGKANLKCRVCDKAFKSLRYLKAHEKNIHGERNFHCNICPMAFAKAAFLSAHLKIHASKFDD